MTIANSTISGNFTVLGGGGISNTASLVLRNVTITDNQADAGGGSYNTGDFLLENTIIAGNTATTGRDCEKHATLGLYDSKGHNLIGTIDDCDITPASSDLTGTDAAPVDPKLGDLAANGGLWETHLPADDSPAV